MLFSLKSHAQPQLSPEEEAPRHYPISVFVQLPWGHWLLGKKILAEGVFEETPEENRTYVRRRSFPFSVGIRGDIVILHHGVSPTYDDQFGLSLGVDLGEIANGLWISTPAEFWWRLFLRHRLAVYAKVGAGVGWVIVSHQEKTNVEFFPVATLGFEYRFSHIFSCRFEAGFPWVRLGLAF
jgi:hypothetical protein